MRLRVILAVAALLMICGVSNAQTAFLPKAAIRMGFSEPARDGNPRHPRRNEQKAATDAPFCLTRAFRKN
jgi:hypothetical protein